MFGERTYRISSLGNLVSDFTTLGAKVYQTLTAGNNAGDGGADAVSSYRSQESYYNTFVYQEDTALPASLKTLFQKNLETAETVTRDIPITIRPSPGSVPIWKRT
ncbi:MAG: hypothetical protein ACLUTU_06465 [Blautia faecis]